MILAGLVGPSAEGFHNPVAAPPRRGQLDRYSAVLVELQQPLGGVPLEFVQVRQISLAPALFDEAFPPQLSDLVDVAVNQLT